MTKLCIFKKNIEGILNILNEIYFSKFFFILEVYRSYATVVDRYVAVAGKHDSQ